MRKYVLDWKPGNRNLSDHFIRAVMIWILVDFNIWKKLTSVGVPRILIKTNNPMDIANVFKARSWFIYIREKPTPKLYLGLSGERCNCDIHSSINSFSILERLIYCSQDLSHQVPFWNSTDHCASTLINGCLGHSANVKTHG